MTVKLLHYTPLEICSTAIRRCWDSHDKSDNGGEKDRELINRVGNKMKHESVKNHINYTFDIQGITTKTLLALTRHDVGVEFSVQSTRYTTAKAVNNNTAGFTFSKNAIVNAHLLNIEDMIRDCVNQGIANDEISLLLPQAWQYNLVCTMSLSALQHFLKLRLKKDAHWDIQDLAKALYFAIPSDHEYLFQDCLTDV